MKKRITSSLMALALCLTLLPATAWATGNEAKIGSTEYATLQGAINAVNNGETIVVLKDITCGTSITINNGKTFTIDFTKGLAEQYTFKWDDTTGSHTDKDIFTIGGNSNVTVKDMKYLAGSNEYGNRIFKVNSTGTLTLDNMTCSSSDNIKDTPVVNNGGTVIVNGGDITITNDVTHSILNPVVQNLGGTTTFTGNGQFTTQNNTGAAWIGSVITQSSDSTDTDRDSNCGTVIIENGRFNGGHILDVNGGGTVTINNATTGTQSGPAIKVFHGGIKSKITINNITSSTTVFTQVIEALETKIEFRNGNVKYTSTRFCMNQSGSETMNSVSIKNGKFGPKSGTTDIKSELQALLADGAAIGALSTNSDGYTYGVAAKQKHDDVTFTPWMKTNSLPAAEDLNDIAGSFYLTEDVTLGSAWSVLTDRANLCLNGHVIKMTGSGSVITVPSGATLNLYDCGDDTDVHKFTVNSTTGLWTLNEEATGDYETVTGGVITGGSGNNGGGVNVSGTLNMYGGNVTGNAATGSYQGGGVYVGDSGTFKMSGGSVTGNTSIEFGGGVYVGKTADVTLGGTAKITDNFKNNTSGEHTANNLFLAHSGSASPADATIALGTKTGSSAGNGVAAPADGMSIGVTYQTVANERITRAGTTVTQDHVKYFFSDSDDYYVTFGVTEGALKLAATTGTGNVLNTTQGKKYNGLGDGTTTGTALEEANANDTLKLLENISYNDAAPNIIVGEKNVTIDLNGKSITVTANSMITDPNGTKLFTVTNSGNLTVKNGTIALSGIMYGGTIAPFTVSGAGSELTLIDITQASNLDRFLTLDGGTATINGGTFGTNNDRIVMNLTNDATLNITNDPTFKCQGNIIKVVNSGDANADALMANVTIDSGTFNGANTAGIIELNGKANVTINGGTFTSSNANSAPIYVETNGYKSSVTINDLTSSSPYVFKSANNANIESFTATVNGGHYKYTKGQFAVDSTNSLKPAIKLMGGFYGPDTADDTALAEITALRASGHQVEVLTSADPEYANGYRYKIVAGAPEPPAPTPPSGGGGSTVTVPVSGDKDSVKISATVSGSNATVKNVTSEQLEKVGTGENVTVDLSGLSKSVSGVTLPKTTLENVAESEASGLEIKLPNGTAAVFDSATVAAVAEQAAGSDVQLVVDKEAKAEQALTAAQKETVKALNDALVLDAYFVSGGRRISDFKGGSAELTVSYPTTKPVRVWYVAEDGTKELVPSTFDGKAATFVVTHFSHYAIEILDGSSYAACPKDATCVYAKFTDADTKAWYHDGVHFCVENGLMSGVGNDLFAPGATLTRGMVVTMLWRLEGEPYVNYAMSFTDVPAGQWYTEAVRWAAAEKIVSGYDAEHFGANDPVTREQLATILYNYAKYKGIDTDKFTENTNTLSHNDVFTISDWATSGMHFCIAAGVVNGDTNGNLNPRSTATRAEAATMFQRFCEAIK